MILFEDWLITRDTPCTRTNNIIRVYIHGLQTRDYCLLLFKKTYKNKNGEKKIKTKFFHGAFFKKKRLFLFKNVWDSWSTVLVSYIQLIFYFFTFLFIVGIYI